MYGKVLVNSISLTSTVPPSPRFTLKCKSLINTTKALKRSFHVMCSRFAIALLATYLNTAGTYLHRTVSTPAQSRLLQTHTQVPMHVSRRLPATYVHLPRSRTTHARYFICDNVPQPPRTCKKGYQGSPNESRDAQ